MMRIERPHDGHSVHEADSPDGSLQRDPAPISGEWTERTSGIARSSARPSAFGPPRSTRGRSPLSEPTPPDDREPKATSSHQATHTPVPCGPIATPVIGTRTATRPTASDDVISLEPGRGGPTDIEQLLPISQRIKSLPKPPRLPTFEVPEETPAASGLPWLSLSVFGCALLASVFSVAHYASQRLSTAALPPLPMRPAATPTIRIERAEPLAARPLSAPDVAPSTAREPEVIARIESAFWGKPELMRDALYEEGRRALAGGDDRLAETLFARLVERDPSSALGASGLAQVRIAQGDLEGAEGWVRVAIREHPREPAYRLLHAEVLSRWGRHAEAQLERALARSLSKQPGRHPAR